MKGYIINKHVFVTDQQLEEQEFKSVLKGLLGLVAFKAIEFILEVVEEIKQEIDNG